MHSGVFPFSYSFISSSFLSISRLPVYTISLQFFVFFRSIKIEMTDIKCWFLCFSGKPIFSVDIHPDGTKFATGGQGKTNNC